MNDDISTQRVYRLFHTEDYNRRIGFSHHALARLTVLRNTWTQMNQAIMELGLQEPYPAMPRNPSYQDIRSLEWLWDDSLKTRYECRVVISNDTYVTVTDLVTPKGMRLSVALDSSDYEDVQITTYRSKALTPGDLITDGDRLVVKTTLGNEGEAVPVEFIGLGYRPEDHGRIVRTQAPTVVHFDAVLTPDENPGFPLRTGWRKHNLKDLMENELAAKGGTEHIFDVGPSAPTKSS